MQMNDFDSVLYAVWFDILQFAHGTNNSVRGCVLWVIKRLGLQPIYFVRVSIFYFPRRREF